MGTKRALIVGIDEYQRLQHLTGCANDALALDVLLAKHYDQRSNFNRITNTSDGGPITREWLLNQIIELFSPGADTALLYFSGHGAISAQKELALCTSESSGHTPGVGISEIMALANGSKVRDRLLILDCCFSGQAGAVPQLGIESGAFLPEGMTILSSSRGDQVSEEANRRGKFSLQLCAALDGGAADVLGRVTTAGLYAYLDESFGAWGQRPVLRANVSRLSLLRNCEPTVTHAQLTRLSELFPDVDAEYQLDPSYEPDSDPQNEQNQATFGILQACRDGKLVVPVGEEHMYYAAMRSKSCRLTPLGRHYCRQIAENIL